MDIEQFYDGDERRRESAEVEFGTEWHDSRGNRYELSWVEDTGELYTMLEVVPEADSWTPFGDVEVEHLPADRVVVRVLADVTSRAQIEDVLAGWAGHMSDPDGVQWVADQLKAHGVAVTPG
jgi:hypothetical protein